MDYVFLSNCHLSYRCSIKTFYVTMEFQFVNVVIYMHVKYIGTNKHKYLKCLGMFSSAAYLYCTILYPVMIVLFGYILLN